MDCQAHQDMEVDPLTVLLARGEQDSPVGELVSALVQMCPWHIPPLIHGCIVPDAYKQGEGETKLGLHHILDCWPEQPLGWLHPSQAHKRLEARSFYIGSKNCGKEEGAEEEETRRERQEGGQGEGEGQG